MKLKVCGLSNPVEVKVCVDSKVSYCGFILNYPKSHRYISFSRAQVLTEIDKKNSKYVGVLVNPNKDELQKYSKLNLDYFQIYGNYSSDSLKEIKKKFRKKIIAALQVNKKEDIKKYKNIEDGSDIILWDSSGYEESLSWDYSWVKSVSVKAKKMVAGNITINRLNELVGLAEIIDVSGALETNKVKDINKIKEFIAEIRKISHEN